MTIAVTVKVHDGIVFASDSASTMIVRDGNGNSAVQNVYNNANKIFNLRKGLPIGAITYGTGSIGAASISTLAKDVRRRFTGDDQDHLDWKLIEAEYTVEQVATSVRAFLFEEKHAEHLAQGGPPADKFGFWVGGYSARSRQSELWQIEITNGQCEAPIKLRGEGETGINWAGQPEALQRLVLGISMALPVMLSQMGLPQEAVTNVMTTLRANMDAQLLSSPMPIQDAIDLARFLVETTIGYARFSPGAPTVGGPIEIAAVTKHEHFKWVDRKHYFSTVLNPKGGQEHE